MTLIRGKVQCLGFVLQETDGWKATFVPPSSGQKGVALLALRILLALVWIPAWMWNFVATPDHEKVYWMIHLTSWSAVFESVFLIVSAVGTYLALYSSWPDGRGADIPWIATVTWAMGAAVPAICTVVCVMFWALVFKPGDRIILHSVAVHGGNLLIALIDLAFSRRPFRFGNVYIPMLFAFTYSVWTLVYFLVGGTHRNGVDPWIYRALYWGGGEARQASVIVIGVVFVAVPLFHVLFSGMLSCRNLCCRGCARKAAPASEEAGVASSDAVPTSA